MFGYSIVKTEAWDRLIFMRNMVGDLHRWLSGFKDLDILWDAIMTPVYPFQTSEIRDKYARAREATVYGQSLEKQRADRLENQLKQATESVRYALATLRSLNPVVFADSDYGLLIAEAIDKLDDSK